MAHAPEHFESHPHTTAHAAADGTVTQALTWAHDVIVIGSVLISAMAVNILSRTHFDITTERAALLSVTVIALASAAHIMIRRRVQPTAIEITEKPASDLSDTQSASLATQGEKTPAAAHDHQPIQHKSSSRNAAPQPTHAPTAVGDTSTTADEQSRIANLQALITELARTVPGPRATTPDPDAHQYQTQRQTIAPSGVIDNQYTALTVAADAMRSTIAPQKSLLDDIADSLAANRVATYLQPIQLLGQQQPLHYELSIRLRDADGRELPHDEVKEEARRQGLLPLIDAAILPRAARIANHLHSRGRRSDILSPINAISITDAEFQSDLDLALAAAPASTIVLTFSQTDVRHFVPAHWSALAAMANLGCRFAIEDVYDLDLDFETLKDHGFDFIKLDAEVLLAGLPSPSGLISPDDLCRYLSTLGYSIIVGRIDDDMTCARILGFGALFGQGQLFGGKRAVRADAVNANAAAA
ncbi:MAG: EAL domain-containing protein [Hyphomicrobiaceae bacterium]